MAYYPCPYLGRDVELTAERERHIARRHPDLLPAHRQCLLDTLVDPDQVRRSRRVSNARTFVRWFENLRGGKYVVLVVVTNSPPREQDWVITAYLTGRLIEGDVEWTRS